MNNHFFSIDEDGDEGAGAAPAAARPNGRSRTGSAGSDGLHSLFPIYEAPQQVFALPAAADLDSTAGYVSICSPSLFYTSS